MYAELDRPQGIDTLRPHRFALGLVLSVIVHALLLFMLRDQRLPTPVIAYDKPMTVWLKAPPAPEPPPPPPPKPVEPVKPKPAPQVRPAPAEQVAPEKAPVEASKPQAAAPETAIIMLPAEIAPATPTDKHFDREAALKMARGLHLHDEPDPKRAGMAVAQLDQQPVIREAGDTKLARDIESATRPDCKKGGSAGLLTPLIWLMDKKDSGCKF